MLSNVLFITRLDFVDGNLELNFLKVARIRHPAPALDLKNCG